jgi:NitT/TauT family transport system ATP-binding protein
MPAEPPDPSPSQPLLRFVDVGRRFTEGRVALEGLDLDIPRGRITSLVGPSGCGKSTALRLLAGLDRPTHGRIEQVAPGEALATGMVFQDAALLPWATAARNVELPLRLRGVEAATRRRRALAALVQVGLADAAEALPHQLSGGMRMRVSMARALVTEPRLWLLDEPFGALDEITRFALNETLLALCAPTAQAPAATAVFVTHSVYEAVFLSHSVVVMGPRGRVIDRIDVDEAGPRDAAFRGTARFTAWCREVSTALGHASGLARTSAPLAAGAPA